VMDALDDGDKVEEPSGHLLIFPLHIGKLQCIE
jgi:hypothetical protein